VHRKIDGKVALVTLDTQPHKVVVLHRLYSKLRRDCNYQQRITYMDGCDCYIAEYLGDFPDAVMPCGNSTHGTEYVRNHPHVLTNIKATFK